MLQLISFSKSRPDNGIPLIVMWDPDNKKEISNEVNQLGSVFLMTRATYTSLEKSLPWKNLFNCGEKAAKVDLKRAFKFDESRDRHRPKLLVFNSKSIGAFRRGLNAFYNRHFGPDDPSCFIIVSDVVFEGMMHADSKIKRSAGGSRGMNEKDSVFQLLNIPDSDPVLKSIEATYIGKSLEVQHTRALIYRASQTESPVLILGESGTGKDVIASQIFQYSKTHKKDFFRVNCSALPESLLEGELFGYKKGSYTGAVADKTGLFLAADKGTIFLDEIGDLSPANQVKILHAVEKKGIRQIGSNKIFQTDVRIIAATNRNLDAMMMRGEFREDLYYRIYGFRITAPPLRAHPEDIPLLARAYWNRHNRKGKLTDKFLNYLKEYYWPGNVRELNSLLNSLVDYFGDITPRAEHVEAIRKSRREMLLQSSGDDNHNSAQLLKLKSQNILINVQNILRSVKIEINNVIKSEPDDEECSAGLKNLKDFIGRQSHALSNLCLEPSYFISWEVFKETTGYRHILDETYRNWPASCNDLRHIWLSELQKLDENLNHRIMEILWGKIDM